MSDHPSARRPVITGLGPISAIGCGVDRFWPALLDGTSGIGPVTLCDVSQCPSKIAAEVKGFDLEDFVPRGKALARGMARPVQLGLAAAALAVEDARLDTGTIDRGRFGVAVGTSVGNLEYLLKLRDEWQHGRLTNHHAAFQSFTHAAACVIGSHVDVHGPIHTTSTGCNSGMDALGHAAAAIQLGAADGMIVVGTDCEVVTEVMVGLSLAGALSTRWNDDPTRASRPFDQERDGNVIGEGAGAIILESAEHAARRGAHIYAEVAGYATRSSGRHRYDPKNPDRDPSTATAALAAALAEAQWKVDVVDVINANGSSSLSYDEIEAQGLLHVFGDRLQHVPVHSIKSMLGQHGAGSSALQLVASALTIDRGRVPPTINCETLDPDCRPLNVVREATPVKASRVLVHSIGFGGFYYSATALAR